MVTLTYTCPETGIVLLGGRFSERTLMQFYHSAAVVKCPACNCEHHPKVHECHMYPGRKKERTLVPLQAS
jgi:hypothetical protein